MMRERQRDFARAIVNSVSPAAAKKNPSGGHGFRRIRRTLDQLFGAGC